MTWYPPVRMRRAVVLGGSMAGLLAARVLSDHADEVVIIERDRLDQAGDRPRPGVPQGDQLHLLLDAGRLQLERWFPGISAEAVSSGAQLSPLRAAGTLFHNGMPLPAPPVAVLAAMLVTRPYLESLVRERVFAISNVEFMPGRAQGLVFSGDRVTGVRYVPAGSGVAEVVTGDLVVDAMGRSSRLGDWLTSEGRSAAPMQRMSVKVNYASLMFARDDQISTPRFMASNVEEPGRTPQGAVVMAVTDDRWLMVQFGFVDDRVTGMDDYVERTKIHPPVFTAIVTAAEPVGDIARYHQADTRRRDYHKLRRFPAGLVVAGDAVASFNPIHGQGMTCAALHASALSSYLRSVSSLDKPANGYFKRVKIITDTAWRTSSFPDLAMSHVDGPYPTWYPVRKWYDRLVFQASSTDPVMAERVGLVNALSAPHSHLVRPRTMGRVLVLAVARALNGLVGSGRS